MLKTGWHWMHNTLSSVSYATALPIATGGSSQTIVRRAEEGEDNSRHATPGALVERERRALKTTSVSTLHFSAGPDQIMR